MLFTSFSKRERQGIYVLLILIAGFLSVPRFLDRYRSAYIPPDSAFLKDVKAFQAELATAAVYRDSLFVFDPNTVTAEQWAMLGLPERTITTIEHYREKGGQFRKREDLQRVYGLSKEQYEKLAPYVQIAQASSGKYYDTLRRYRDTGYQHKAYLPYFTKREPIILDINLADSAAFESLPGIGPVLAARIIRFRDRLGGFYTVSQVSETYGLPDTTFKKIQSSLRLGPFSLKKLDLNQTDEKSLAQHPYIRYKLARLIVLYRSNHGPFSQPRDLLGIPLVDDSIYRKLEPYIKTENTPQ
jgi:competence protein ComEA